MLFAFLDTQEDFSGAAAALSAIPSLCKTEGIQNFNKRSSSSSSSSSSTAADNDRVDCNLTGVDPECFLVNLAGQVGKTWGTQLADEQRAAEMVQKLLQGEDATLQAAVAACAATPLAVPLLVQFGSALPSPAAVVAEASAACRV
ncbi:hypothetical protein, conserved [Eimeria necatrix]|uniref:Uncharacterized protein n=1 Tax=Eimeria necatrix TaxID=51315 RepID=U6MTR1_9EIME|nr:hypothetical protein, conserved [Eimeria necatrix]CDJ66483.1 hypothetical protein, conserved [Eimeria necatrix]